MARKPTLVNSYALSVLRGLVQKKAQSACDNHAAIRNLQTLIVNEQEQLLSVQTLNRFFGLVASPFTPSIDTLDILSAFVGFEHFRQFEQLHNEPAAVTTTVVDQDLLLLHGLLANVAPSHAQDSVLLQVFRNIIKVATLKPHLWAQLYPQMAALPIGRQFFFEQLVHMDALNGHYGDGLAYYLLHAQNPMQKIFGHALMVLRHFLVKGKEKQLYHQGQVERAFSENNTALHPWISGQLAAARVLDAATNGKGQPPVDQLLDHAMSRATPNLGYPNFPSIHYLLGESLVLTGSFEDAFWVLSEGSYLLRQNTDDFDPGYRVQYEWLHLLSGLMVGLITQEEAGQKAIRLSGKPVYFLSADYFGIISNIVRLVLATPVAQIHLRNSIDQGILRTGFVVLQKLVDLVLAQKNALMEING